MKQTIKLEGLKSQYEKLGEEIKKLEEKDTKIDYSKFVGRCGQLLAIKGDKYLKSFYDTNISLSYNNEYKDRYTDKLKYEIIYSSELKEGDVFVECKYERDLDVSNFGIFIGKDIDEFYIYQKLEINDGIEVITHDYLVNDDKYEKLVRFLRE